MLTDSILIRETIGYDTVAADGIKDILIMSSDYIVLLKVKHDYNLRQLYNENGCLQIDTLQTIPDKRKWIVQKDAIERIEISKLQKIGHSLWGNRKHCYEVRVKSKSHSSALAFYMYEISADNILKKFKEDYSAQCFIDVDTYSIKIKHRLHVLKFSGLYSVVPSGVLCLFIASIVLLFNFKPYFDKNKLMPVFRPGFIEAMELAFILPFAWPLYRLYRNLTLRQPSENSKKSVYRRNIFERFFLFNQPLQNSLIGILLKLIGVSCSLFFLFLYFKGSLADLFINNQIVDHEHFDQSIKALLVVGLFLLYLGYRISISQNRIKVKERITPTNKKKLILYLRSFNDDGQYSFNRGEIITLSLLGVDFPYYLKRVLTGWLSNFHPYRAIRVLFSSTKDTAEEQLVSFMNRYGRTIAIGRPGEAFVQGGAVREYVKEEVWKEVVEEYIQQSDIVVIQPSSTEGIWWELDKTLSYKNHKSVLFNFVNCKTNPEIYENFKNVFTDKYKDYAKGPLPIKMPDEHFLYFDQQRKPVFLPTLYLSPFLWPISGYVINFKKTLSAFLHQLGIRNQKRENQRPKEYFRFSIIAILLSYLLWIEVVWGLGKKVTDLMLLHYLPVPSKISIPFDTTFVDYFYSSAPTQAIFNAKLFTKAYKRPLNFESFTKGWIRVDSAKRGWVFLSNDKNIRMSIIVLPSITGVYLPNGNKVDLQAQQDYLKYRNKYLPPRTFEHPKTMPSTKLIDYYYWQAEKIIPRTYSLFLEANEKYKPLQTGGWGLAVVQKEAGKYVDGYNNENFVFTNTTSTLFSYLVIAEYKRNYYLRHRNEYVPRINETMLQFHMRNLLIFEN